MANWTVEKEGVTINITTLGGAKGADGTDGIDGTNGIDGVDGTNGVDGINGTNGTNGIDGVDGNSFGLVSKTTFALLQTYPTPDVNTSYKVTNDANTSLNGYYHWVSGTNYVKDYDLANGIIEKDNADAVSGGAVYNSYSFLPTNNFYDISMVTETEWVNQVGTVSSSLALGLARIPVKENTTYCFRHSDNSYIWASQNGIAYFDANGIKISVGFIHQMEVAQGLGGRVFTTPANCAFFLHNLNQSGHDYRSDFTLQEGNTTTAYKPYTPEIEKVIGVELRDNTARKKIIGLESLNGEVSKTKGEDYQSQSLTQIFNSLDTIRTDALNTVTNADLGLASPLTLGSSFILTKSYVSDAIISNIKLSLADTTPVGIHTIYVYVVNENDIITQNQGSVEVNVELGTSIYSILVDDFVLPMNHFIGVSTSDDVRVHYGNEVGASIIWRYKSFDPDENKNIGDNFFANGFFNREDAPAISWDATLKVFNSVVNNNYLSGLKLVGIGDSMMQEYLEVAYIKSIASRNSMDMLNLGISGNRITDTGGVGIAMVNRVNDIPLDTQILVIDCGTNDALQSITIGLENSVDDTEFNGAINLFLDAVLTRIPTAGIVWNGIRQGGADLYNDAIITQCEKRQIPILNNFKEGGIYISNTAQYNALTRQDNIHLSKLGIKRHSYKVEGFIRSNIGGFAVL